MPCWTAIATRCLASSLRIMARLRLDDGITGRGCREWNLRMPVCPNRKPEGFLARPGELFGHDLKGTAHCVSWSEPRRSAVRTRLGNRASEGRIGLVALCGAPTSPTVVTTSTL
jgi:hypothetical protein